MEIIILPSLRDAAVLGARRIASHVRSHARPVLGLATGSTVIPLYDELIRLHREEGLDFSHVTTFNLDEYVGLSADHAQSYHAFMRDRLFSHVNIAAERIHIPDGMTGDIPACCEAFESAIREAGGIDIQILGIGSDGHIGFNEPGSSLASRTRIKTLTRRTRNDNARFFADPAEVPHHVITMGVGTILDAREVLLFAAGESKADAIAATVEGPVTASVPASALQLHRTVKVFVDEPAASRLERAEYYRWVYDNKP